MSSPTYASGNDWEIVPDHYSLLDSEPPSPNFEQPPAIPVSTRLSVPTTMKPSIPEVFSPPLAYQPLSSPSSSRSISSPESSDSFENHNRAWSSTGSSSHASHHNPIDCEFSRAQGNLGRSSPLSTEATSLASSQDHIEIIPVSLSINDPEWIHILAGNESGGIEEFARTVRRDSMRVGYLKEIKASREHNRVADLRNEPLAPIRNKSGLTMPLGYHHPITSISQICEMPLAELDAWLLHYAIQTAPGVNTKRPKQRALARHVGVATPNTEAATKSAPLGGSVSF